MHIAQWNSTPLPGLMPVERRHVTLLYLGGRSACKAAPLNNLSVEDLELMTQALQDMKGMEVGQKIHWTRADRMV